MTRTAGSKALDRQAARRPCSGSNPRFLDMFSPFSPMKSSLAAHSASANRQARNLDRMSTPRIEPRTSASIVDILMRNPAARQVLTVGVLALAGSASTVPRPAAVPMFASLLLRPQARTTMIVCPGFEVRGHFLGRPARIFGLLAAWRRYAAGPTANTVLCRAGLDRLASACIRDDRSRRSTCRIHINSQQRRRNNPRSATRPASPRSGLRNRAALDVSVCFTRCAQSWAAAGRAGSGSARSAARGSGAR
jgi:hypothetical protein